MHKGLLGLGLSTAVLAVFAAAFAPACSSSSPDPYPDVASFCAARAKAECQIAPTCAIDAAACAQVRTAACTQDAAAATASGMRAYKSGNVQACIDKLNGAFGGSSTKVVFADLQGPGSIQDKCERVFEGKADKGQACTSDYDCTSNRVCAAVAPGATQKVCADSVTKNLNDFCSDPGSTCAAGTYCEATQGGAPQCKAKAAKGAACDASTPCLESLRCVGGTCADRATLGSSCATNDDCSPDGPFCDPYANNICTIGLTFATGALDCKAFSAAPAVDAGGGTPDAAPAADAAAPVDAATGG